MSPCIKNPSAIIQRVKQKARQFNRHGGVLFLGTQHLLGYAGSWIERMNLRVHRQTIEKWLLRKGWLHLYSPAAYYAYVRAVRHIAPVSGWVLDAGQGQGAMSRYYPGNPQRLIGVDIQTDNGIKADIRYLPFKRGVFSQVLAFNVAEHVADTPMLLRELRRVLKTGHLVYLLYPFTARRHTAYDYYRFSEQGMEHLLHTAGFLPHFSRQFGGSLASLGHLLCSLCLMACVFRPLFYLLFPVNVLVTRLVVWLERHGLQDGIYPQEFLTVAKKP